MKLKFPIDYFKRRIPNQFKFFSNLNQNIQRTKRQWVIPSMQRNSNLNKILINRFVIFVFCFIALTYYVFVFQFMASLMDKYPGTSAFFLIFFHLSFMMMLWSLLTAMFTEPGKVPLYWVFELLNNFLYSYFFFYRDSF